MMDFPYLYCNLSAYTRKAPFGEGTYSMLSHSVGREDNAVVFTPGLLVIHMHIPGVTTENNLLGDCDGLSPQIETS